MYMYYVALSIQKKYSKNIYLTQRLKGIRDDRYWYHSIFCSCSIRDIVNSTYTQINIAQYSNKNRYN